MGAAVTVVPIRSLTIGGSDAAAAAGIHPHVSRVALWLEKTGRVERRETEAMRWGTALEPLILDALMDRGWALESPLWNDEGYRDKERPWLVGHLDSFGTLDPLSADPQSRVVVEVKTANLWAARSWDGPPLEYVAQCQVYMHLTGLNRALLAVLVGGQRLELHEIDRDERAIRLLLGRLEDFYGYLVRDVPPPPDGSDSSRDALLAMFPQAREGERVRLDASHELTYKTLRTRRRQRDVLDGQITKLENELKAFMGDAETAITRHDAEAVHWRTTHTRRFDVSRFKSDHPALHAEYLAETTTRRFTVV